MNTEGKKTRTILAFVLIATFSICFCSIASAQTPKPNLIPSPPPGCSSGGSVVMKNPTCTAGCSDDIQLNYGGTLYFDWGVTNNGYAPTTTSAGIYIYVDDKLIINNGMAIPPLSANQTAGCIPDGQGGGAACLNCPSITGLCPGEHRIRFVVDSLNAIDESNESDNEYTRTFTISNPQPPTVPQVLSITLGGTYYNPWTRGYNIPTNASAAIQFSMSMDTTDSFLKLRDEYDNDMPGTVQWSTTCFPNDTATFVPEHSLKPASHYQLRAQAWSAGGAGIGTPNNAFDFNFFTKPSTADTTPPVVQTVYPYKDMTDVPTTTEILIKFSEAMNPGSINSSPTTNNITLAGDGINAPSDYNVFYDFTQGFAHIRKNTPLSPSNEYTVTVTPYVRDLRGNWLKEQYQWKFTTGAADTTPPTVLQTIPANGATNVSPNAYIHIVFSEEMDQWTLNAYNPNNIRVQDEAGSDFTYNPYSIKDSVTLLPSISPQGPLLLQNGHHYTVTISSGVKDLAGNPVSPYIFSFTVAGASDDSVPVLLQGIGSDFQRGERYSGGSSRLKLQLEALDDQTNSLTVTAVTPPPPLAPTYNWPFTTSSDGWYSYESTRDEGLSPGTHTLAFTIKDGATPQNNEVTFQRDVYIFESTPILSSPTDQASGVSTTPTFHWSYNPTDRPLFYAVAVFDGPDPKTAHVVWQDFAYDNGGATYSLSIPADKTLTSNTTYYWSVWGETKQGNGVTYSAVSSFTTGGTPPPEPRFQTVLVRSDVRPTGPQWNLMAFVLGPSPADIVALKVTGPEGFQYIFTEDDILQGEQNGMYFWRVLTTSLSDGIYVFTVTDSQGRTVTRNFSFSNPLPGVPIPRVSSSTMSPADNSYVSTTTPILSWTGVGGTYYYRIRIFDWNSRQDAVYTSDFTQEPNTHITVPAGYLLPNTPYKWRVEVYDTQRNNRSVSETLRFSTGSYPYTLDIPSAYVWSDNNYYNAATKSLGANVIGPLPNEVTQITVAGPSFSYNFNESNIQLDLEFQGALYGYGGGGFATDGPYAFSVQDKYGATKSYQKDQTSAAIPIVDLSSLSPANNAYIDNLTPTFAWTAVDGSNLYYRVKINDWMQRYTVYNSPVSTNLYATIPPGVLKPNRSYKWRVEVFDNSDRFAADNRSSSAWNSFSISDAATTPPSGSIVINGDASYTNSTSVSLTLSASDANGVSGMCISNSDTSPCSPWEPYSPPLTKPWILSSGDGIKNVYAWFKDGLENVNTVPYSDSIILDTTPPVLSSFSAVPGNAQVTLTWSGSDVTSGIGSYTLIYSITGIPNSCSDGIPIYSGSNTSHIHAGLTNGVIHYYRVCATDHVGNTSSGATVSAIPTSINTPPLAPTNVQAGEGLVDRVQVTWTGSFGAMSYEVWRNTANDPNSATQIASSIVGPPMYMDDLTSVGGTKYYYWVKAKNPFGTSGFSAPDTGYRGTTPPPGNLLTVMQMGTGGGTIMSSVPGINCVPDCSEIYDAGTSVILTPNPNSTSRFTGWSGDYGSVSGNQCTVYMTAGKTVTANFVYRRLDILDIAVYNGSLTGLFSVFPGFRDLLQSATLTGPDGFFHQYDLQNETLRWLSECRYLDGWITSFSSFDYGEYTLTLNFYDGVTETHKKNLQPASVTAVATQSITVNILTDGSANVAWSPSLTGQYYGVRVRSADGSVEYFRSPAQLNATSLMIPAQNLGCLVRGQSYRWLVRAYDSPEMGYEGASTFQAVATSYIELPYNPSLPGQRTTTYTATDWDGKLMLGFDVRPGSRGEVTQASVTGPNGFSYQFDLSADKIDFSTATRTNRLWWEHFNPPFKDGDYIFQIVFSDGHTDTLTKTLNQVDITPVTTGMTAAIQPNGAVRFNWALPSPPPVVNQSYEVRIRSLDGTKEYYSSSRLVNQSMVFASFWELRGLEHCKSYQWFVRAYDQFSNAMRQSSSQTFFYNPFNLPYHTLSVTKFGSGSGTVTSSPAGVINCGSDCTESYIDGMPPVTLTLAAMPYAGSVFTGWSGACSETGQCTVLVSSNITVTANFLLDMDGDGIDDAWEDQYCGGDCDPSGDLDYDGLTNLQEYQIGTDPNNPDSDEDGLWDSVDEQPVTESNDFRDSAITYGTILDRGDQTLIIRDEVNPADGVKISAELGGGELPAKVSVCGSASISLRAGNEVVATCGSVTIKVVQGTVDVILTATDGTTAATTLVKNHSLEFEPTTFTFTAPETNLQPVVIIVEDKEFSIPAGETLTVIEIDIKPGSYPNSISLKKKGTIPVAILSTAGFDAPSSVNGNSLKFGRTGEEASLDFCSPTPKDVDNNGLGDLICHFTTQKTQFTISDTVGILKGKKLDGSSIEATDSVRIVP